MRRLHHNGGPRLYGPYVVDYTDIPQDGDTMTLWMPQVGDHLLRLYQDPFYGQAWNNTNAVLRIGQYLDSDDDALWAGTVPAGDFLALPFPFRDALPMAVSWVANGDPAPSTGHLRLYALVAHPVSP